MASARPAARRRVRQRHVAEASPRTTSSSPTRRSSACSRAGTARAELDAIHAELSALVADGRLRNAVTAEVPFDELPAALQRMADRAVVGKLVMVP